MRLLEARAPGAHRSGSADKLSGQEEALSTTRGKQEDRADVVVLGDGPAGAVAALTLAESGARVVLLGVRRRGAAAARIGQCLPAQGSTWMRALGLAERFWAGPHRAIVANRSAWSGAGIEAEDLIKGAHGHSWMLDRGAFDALLRNAAIARGAFHEVAPGRVQAEPCSHGWRFRLRSGVIDAGFAVDASGRAASLALRNGARRHAHDRLVAAVAVLGTGDADRDQTTLIEAVEQGWWYSCRIGSGQRVVSLFTDGDLLPRGRAERAAFFAARLGETRHMQRLIAHGGAPRSPPEVVLANSARLDRPAGDRWIAAGDAAASYDPLCGHGLIAAMDSGRHAAAALVDLARGELAAVDRYCDLTARRYTHYLGELAESYAAQPRWRASTFWDRRR